MDRLVRPSTLRWIGTLVVDGQHHPACIACSLSHPGSVRIEVEPLPNDASPLAGWCAAFDIPLSTQMSSVLSMIVDEFAAERGSAASILGVGAIIPPRLGCDAIVFEYPSDAADSADPPRVATIRRAGVPDAERCGWTDETSLAEWLGKIEAFCRRRDTIEPIEAGVSPPQRTDLDVWPGGPDAGESHAAR